jgi:hypothetical protein
MRDQCRWFGGMVGNHVADIVAKYGDTGEIPQALTNYIKGREGHDYNEHGQAGNVQTAFVGTRSLTASACWARPMITLARSSSGKTWESTSSPATCNTTTRKRRSGSTAKRSCPRCANT